MSVQLHQFTRRIAVYLMIDSSYSMTECASACLVAPIEAIPAAYGKFAYDLSDVKHCGISLKISTFAGEVQDLTKGFEDIASLRTLPDLTVRSTGTDLGGALQHGLDSIEEHQSFLQSTGVETYKPMLVVMTDGEPNRNSAPGVEDRLVDSINANHLHFIPVAIGRKSAYPVLEALSPKLAPIVIDATDPTAMTFSEFFRFISESIEKGKEPDFLS